MLLCVLCPIIRAIPGQDLPVGGAYLRSTELPSSTPSLYPVPPALGGWLPTLIPSHLLTSSPVQLPFFTSAMLPLLLLYWTIPVTVKRTSTIFRWVKKAKSKSLPDFMFSPNPAPSLCSPQEQHPWKAMPSSSVSLRRFLLHLTQPLPP